LGLIKISFSIAKDHKILFTAGIFLKQKPKLISIMNISKSKLIAIAIFAFLFFVPFRYCFFTDEIVSGGKFIGLFITNVIGFFIAFGIGTNEPFDKKKVENKVEANKADQYRKAA
jgi:hypothetical protein